MQRNVLYNILPELDNKNIYIISFDILFFSMLIWFEIFIIISVVIFVYLSLATLAVYKDTYAAYEPSNKNWFYKNHFTGMNYLKNYSILNLKLLRL